MSTLGQKIFDPQVTETLRTRFYVCDHLQVYSRHKSRSAAMKAFNKLRNADDNKEVDKFGGYWIDRGDGHGRRYVQITSD